MKTVYLAGPINGCTDDEAHDWRQQAISRLQEKYRLLNPMDRDYRGMEDENVEAIVGSDYDDILASDFILVNAERPSWGTAMEVWLANSMGKKVIVVCPGRVSPWLRYCADRVFPSMDLAIAHLRHTPS